MQIISRCEVCDGKELVPVLDLGDQPMCDDLVPIGSREKPSTYPLRLSACPECLTVHQTVQVEKKLLFPLSYHYRASMTQDVLHGMAELVDVIENIVGDLSGKQVLDIGCNDGSLLAIFRSKGARTAGIEPTGAARDAEERVHNVFNRFFDAAAVEEYLSVLPKPDIITFTNVFAHIEDLTSVLTNLKALLKPETKLVIENHYLGAVIERNQFDTFYHEHPRTYSYRSFQHIADKLASNIEYVDFPPRYNGNIRVVIGSGSAARLPLIDESHFLESLRGMAQLVARAKERSMDQLSQLVSAHGRLPGKAFPGRASVIIHAFGVGSDLIDATYERSASPKIGHYVPGTEIEIRDEAEFFAKRVNSPVLINFAWHIHSEIERYMRSHGYSGQIVPIFQ